MPVLKLEDVDDRQLEIYDLPDLLDAIEDVAIHYSNIGLALGIKYSELEIIERKYQYDARNGLKEVLKLWLNLKYTKKKQDNPQWPSWRKVVEVADKSWAGNNHALAIEIANAHPYTPGAIGKPERVAKMREVNTTTTEETSMPTTEVPLPPSQDATEPARSQTAQPLDRSQPQQPVGVSHSANKDEQPRLIPPGYYFNKSGTECPTKASNQNASSAQATPPSQSQSSAQELERDFSRVVGLSQQPSNSTAPSSRRGLTSSMATSDAQYRQAFQTGDYPLQSMSHNDYPPQQVPTQQVLPTSPSTLSDPNSKLVDGSGPPRPTAVYSGTQPTEAGSGSQVLITPSSAVTKNFTSDSEVDLPSEGASPNSTLNAQGKTASRLKRGGAHHGAVGEKSQEPTTQQRQSAVQPSPTQPPVSQPHPPPSVPHPQPSGDQHQHAGYFYTGPYGVPPNPSQANVQGTTGPPLQYIAGHHNSGAAGSVHHPQCPPGMQAPGHYWPMQFPYGYYPSAAGYFSPPWSYYPPSAWQPTMPPQQDVPAQYRAGAALPLYPPHVPPPPAAHPPHSSPALETQQSENEEISEGSVAGTPHEAKSQDEGELYSEKVLRYEAVTPQVATDLGKKRPGHIVPLFYRPYTRECKFNKIGLSFSHSIIEPAKPEEGARKPDNTYGMTCCPHGYAVIINNCSFRRHDTRDGTNVDCKDLVLTFQYLGYRVEEHSNLTSSQITQLFEEIRWRDHSDFDSFVCCILSHGKNNYIYGSDSKKVEVKSLTYKLSSGPCPTLTGKPKLFFIQACRGSFTGGGAQTDGGNAAVEKCSLLPSIETPSPGEAPAASDAVISTVADFFVGYSTSADYVSYRDPHHGSWYIWELCDALCNWSTCKPLRDIMDTVHERVNVEHSSLTEKQAPDYSCSLMRKVFFW